MNRESKESSSGFRESALEPSLPRGRLPRSLRGPAAVGLPPPAGAFFFGTMSQSASSVNPFRLGFGGAAPAAVALLAAKLTAAPPLGAPPASPSVALPVFAALGGAGAPPGGAPPGPGPVPVPPADRAGCPSSTSPSSRLRWSSSAASAADIRLTICSVMIRGLSAAKLSNTLVWYASTSPLVPGSGSATVTRKSMVCQSPPGSSSTSHSSSRSSTRPASPNRGRISPTASARPRSRRSSSVSACAPGRHVPPRCVAFVSSEPGRASPGLAGPARPPIGRARRCREGPAAAPRRPCPSAPGAGWRGAVQPGAAAGGAARGG